jgi:hypothetical protein
MYFPRKTANGREEDLLLNEKEQEEEEEEEAESPSQLYT